MAEDTQQLTSDIEVTRSNLSSDLDALADRVTPGKIVERRVEKTKTRASGLKDRIMGTATGAKSKVMGSAGAAKSNVMGSAQSAAGSTSGAASGLSDRAHGAASGLSDKAHGAADSATGAISDTKESVIEHAEGNPLAAGAIAFGIGWVISGLIPASDKETRAAHAMVDTAKAHAGPITEHVKSVGQDVASNLQGKAQEAAASVQATAKESAAHVTDEAKGGAQSVAADAKNS